MELSSYNNITIDLSQKVQVMPTLGTGFSFYLSLLFIYLFVGLGQSMKTIMMTLILKE